MQERLASEQKILAVGSLDGLDLSSLNSDELKLTHAYFLFGADPGLRPLDSLAGILNSGIGPSRMQQIRQSMITKIIAANKDVFEKGPH